MFKNIKMLHFWYTQVVCRQLGYTPTSEHLHNFGVGDRRFPGSSVLGLLNHLSCRGTEDRVNECIMGNVGNSHDHESDAGVICGDKGECCNDNDNDNDSDNDS